MLILSLSLSLSLTLSLSPPGADQEHKTDEMHTALMEASMDGHVDVARLLLDHGAQVWNEVYFRIVFQKGRLYNVKICGGGTL